TNVKTYCVDPGTLIKIADLEWYPGTHGFIEEKPPCLAICFENGKIQIMRDEKDTDPVIFDTSLRFLRMKWNHNGSVLAVSGVQYTKSAQGEEKEICLVQFYDPFGQYIRSLKIPGKRITSISWEYSGLRLSLTVDSFIYFANIRQDYKWAFFANDVLLYTYIRPEQAKISLVFWNVKTNERNLK
ncbi:WD repeat-containing protein 35, partial [Nowakowskiella sp. JEL0407]